MALPAIPAVLGFIAKTPKFFGHIFKATKNSTQVFTKAGKTIKNSKIYKITGTLLGEDPIKYMRDAAASALKNGGGVEVLKSFTNGVMNGSNRFDSMNSTALKTMLTCSITISMFPSSFGIRLHPCSFSTWLPCR